MSSSSFSISALTRVFSDSSRDLRAKIIGIFALILAINIVVWGAAFFAFSGVPALLVLAVNAYVLGLRHAVDADHISAIDNVTRKLMQEKKQPVAVGFFFSLGHSTIVIALSVFIAITAAAFKNFDNVGSIGSLIGTSVSAFFMFAIAIIN